LISLRKSKSLAKLYIFCKTTK